jgi:hypothetical protein
MQKIMPSFMNPRLAKFRTPNRWMAALHPAYANYLARTRRFIPFIL